MFSETESDLVRHVNGLHVKGASKALCLQLVVLSECVGVVKRCEWVRSLVCALGWRSLSLPLCFSVSMNWTAVLCHTPQPGCCTRHWPKKQRSQRNIDQNLWNHDPKWNFYMISWLDQVLCLSGWTLTNTRKHICLSSRTLFSKHEIIL